MLKGFPGRYELPANENQMEVPRAGIRRFPGLFLKGEYPLDGFIEQAGDPEGGW